MSDVFKKDPDFKLVYEANIAMLLYDNGCSKKTRDKVATEIMTLIFDKEG